MSKTNNISKQAGGITYTGGWIGLAGGDEIQLEVASDIIGASGKLGINTIGLADDATGTAKELEDGIEFNYDSALGAVYDDANSGALTGKFRVIEDGTNVSDAGGLNLTPIAKSLVKSNSESPQADEIFIDPISSKFKLPQPVYWSKCESLDNLTVNPNIASRNQIVNSIIANGGGVPYFQFDTNSPKFGTSAHLLGADNVTNVIDWKPLGSNTLPPKGTASFYWKTTNQSGVDANANVFFNFGSSGNNRFGAIYETTGGEFIWTGTTSANINTSGHHYVVWDESGSLTGGNTIRYYIDGVLVLSTSGALTRDEDLSIELRSAGASGSVIRMYMDNLKIWNHVIEEIPNMEYNGGTGNEDALHPIYGVTYKPVDLEVGYFDIATSNAPAKSNTKDDFVSWSN